MNQSSSKAVKSIGRSISNINKQIEILRLEYPDACNYLDNGDSFNVSITDSCNQDLTLNERQSGCVATFSMKHTDCGGW
ncbi:MAG: hypothetical protein Tp1137MES00d2C23059491_25 [Prokaryotic dsDNA virus sp.]|nr:MAG: hypothetical protein Tp1137MES00d2C23059491_25 [Prokaryotic dsDNA virus sp.]|tara:strand:+ start:5927 stop:6163 length:237 start_codon:yes stop_codon:yes gene_type:complete